MAEPIRYPEIAGGRSRRGGCLYVVAAAIVILLGARSLASLLIDYNWWREMHQVETWYAIWLYSVVPMAVAAVIAFAVLWFAHARALKFAGVRLGQYRWYARGSALVLLIISIILVSGAIDSWTVVRFFGGRSLSANPNEWHDPVFGNPLAFYLFDLPFYSVLLRLVLAITVAAILIYWLAGRGWQLRARVKDWTQMQNFDLRDLGLKGALESRFLRALGAVFLIALAVRFYLSRYSLLQHDHGFMVGIDYVDQYIGLPLQWLLVIFCLAGAAAFLVGRPAWALIVVVGLILRAVVPPLVGGVYVRPNE
ncbi:MAG: UPF0182 family protein, partial [Bryobacteraceae bacterium]